jgi:hypothetical protein
MSVPCNDRYVVSGAQPTTFVSGSCEGLHVGKFSSCADEAIWHESLDVDWTGSSDFEGSFALITFGADEDITISSGSVVRVPAGIYLVHSATSGSVTVYSDRAENVQAMYRRAEIAYEGWDAQEWCEECPEDARCESHELMLTDPAVWIERHGNVTA